MKKGKGMLMKVTILLVILIAVGLITWQTTSKKEGNNNFSEEVAPYTESEELEVSFPIKEELEINSSICNIVLKQGKCSDITVKLTKKVGDKQKEHLKDELKKISCRMTEQRLELGYLDGVQPEANSKYVRAEITIPDTVKILTVDNHIGDVEVTGEFDMVSTDTNIGNVKLNIKKLDNMDSFILNGSVGDVFIKLPKGSKINLCGKQADDAVLDGSIVKDTSGAVMEINNQTAKIKISN